MPWATAYVPNQPGRVLCDGCGAISRACFFGKNEAAKRASAHFKGKKKRMAKSLAQSVNVYQMVKRHFKNIGCLH